MCLKKLQSRNRLCTVQGAIQFRKEQLNSSAFALIHRSLKVKVIPKHLLFCVYQKQVISLQSACYPKNIHLERSSKFDFGGHHFEALLGSQAIFCDVIQSGSKLEGRRKTCNWLCILHKVNEMCFPSNYPLHYPHCYYFWSLEYVWLKIIQSKSTHNPEWY